MKPPNDSFYQTFLQGGGNGNPPGPEAPLFQFAVFGKHPGWDDHMEDIGMTTQALVTLKRLLYIEGIGSQIDRARWESLEPSSRLDTFDHVFVWLGPNEYLFGKLWSSSDGKRRTSYPMVACAHVSHDRLPNDLDAAIALLEDFEDACKATNTPEGVAQAHAQTANALLQVLAADPGGDLPGPDDWKSFLAAYEMAPEQEGFFRILHAAQSNFEPFRPAARRAKDWSPNGEHLRVPLCADTDGLPFHLWSGFFRSQLDPAIPLLLLSHMGSGWIDVIAGEPGPDQFFILRANAEVVPFTNSIPYQIPEESRERFGAVLESFTAAEGERQSIWPDDASEEKGVLKQMKRWMKADSS